MNKLSNSCLSSDIADHLVSRIDAIAVSGRIGRGELVRVAVPVEGVSVMEWFRHCTGGVRFYFAGRDDCEVAGCGMAHKICEDTSENAASALRTVSRNLARWSGPIRYYGGICFDSAQPADADDPFGRFCFFVPELEMRRTDSGTSLAFNTLIEPQESIDAIRSRLKATLARLRKAHEQRTKWSPDCTTGWRMTARADIPDEQSWRQDVETAIAAMQSHSADKVVLSRRTDLEISEPVDPGELLCRISSGNTGTYDFCFQFADKAFLGSSPERLYRRRRRMIYTEALAGTCPVGQDEVESRGFRARLRESAKEAEEHGYVFEDLRRELAGICLSSRAVSRRDVLTLSHVQHFCSRFEGQLRPDITAADIVQALHPTSAVNGAPKAAALDLIRAIERQGRGWYAGPVGWLGRDEDDFAVGIRSCIVQGHRIRLFAGAGIVRASDPKAEWLETEAKMRQFLEAFE